MSYDNTNTGVLFKNDRKESEKQPDYKGSVNVGGAEFWLAAWVKTGKKGKFMSLAITAKDKQQAPKKPVRQEEPNDDDIPF